ncbi:MAG: phosphate ABC transporter permease PtsA [Acidobacteria bacterium]|nr:MAG: phosphate ABC transporter permease PtsA [Acidobacteriota bacterium]PYV71293.1 MAG: phosphate ABC transporter permease PtsA [Acidobacteriota bacterium]
MSSKYLQFRRRVTDYFATFVAALLSAVVVGTLLAIFAYLIVKGAGSVNWAFLTHTPKPVGEIGGGMANAIVGSTLILGMGSLMGIPFGIGAGIYLAEYGRNRFGAVIRFTADVLNGVPSIVIGLVAYGLVVFTEGHFSAFAGAVALAIMMIPMVARTTEQMLLLVPQAVREAAFGLGIPQWRTTISITLATARAGILTGIMLAFARIAGETAPLMFTALGNQFWSFSANQPIAAVPLQIYTYALSPYDDWHRQAWAGALVLVALIVGTISLVRFIFARSTLREAR